MRARDSLTEAHPAVSFAFFALVVGSTMFLMHPACLAISLGAAVWYHASLRGWEATARLGLYLLPTSLVAAALNALLNHRGETVLFDLPSGNGVTLESVAYGGAAAAMLAAVVLWFACYNQVMTSDKFLFLFRRAAPALSLVLSMTLRFVPRFKTQLQAAAQAQEGLGRSVTEGPVRRRAGNAVAILSILLTWSLENGAETADSMASRGYGLPGRGSFALYRLTGRDRTALLWLAGWGLLLLCAGRAGGFAFQYYPNLAGGPANPLTGSFFLGYLALCLTPVIWNRGEDLLWRHSASET